MATVRWVLYIIVNLYNLILLARVAVSWFDAGQIHPVSRLVVRLTEPVLAPIRRLLPPTGMIDFSPVIAFMLLAILLNVILNLL